MLREAHDAPTNDVSTTSAPSSCARPGDTERDRGVVEHAGDQDPLVGEQHLVLAPYLVRQSGVLEWRRAGRASAVARQHVERVDEDVPGPLRLDHRVDEPSVGAAVVTGSRRSCGYVGDERRDRRGPCSGSAPWPPSPITAIRARATRSHRSLPMPREFITMYVPPYALRNTTHMRGDGRRRVGVHQLGAVTDHAAPIEVATGLEARGSTNVMIVRLNISHVATNRAALRDASMSSVPACCSRLVGDDPTGTPAERP